MLRLAGRYCAPFPERLAFIQIVRSRESCRLALHVVVDAVYHDIISGRIDVLELLRCRDMWFFAEIRLRRASKHRLPARLETV